MDEEPVDVTFVAAVAEVVPGIVAALTAMGIDADYKAIVAKGMPYRVTFPVNAGVRRVRAIVYDFKADLLGSADTFVS